MNTKPKAKEKLSKGRRWRFSKKKMKVITDETNLPELPLDLKELLEKEGKNLKPPIGTSKVSRLSPSLLDILKKSVALGYFLEYLKEQNKKELLDFWLEAETLHLVSESNYLRRTNSDTRRRSRTSSASSLKKSQNTYEEPRETSMINRIIADETVRDPSNSIDSACWSTESEDSSSKSVNVEFGSEKGSHFAAQDPILTKCNDINTHEDYGNPNHEQDENLNSTLKTVENYQEGRSDSYSKDNQSKVCVIDGAGSTAQKNQFTHALSNESPQLDEKKVRRSSTLRTYSEFKQRAKSRGLIVDAVSIYSKYISLNADFPINLPSPERQLIEANICCDENSLDPLCFVKAQEFVFGKLEGLYEEFLQTTYMMSYQLKVLEENGLRLQDVLYEDGVLFYFLEFLDLHNVKRVYEFYVTSESFEEDIDTKMADATYDKELAVNDAMNIYERYFSMKCENQLISDDKLRIVLENNICREDGPQSNCFCIPKAYAWTALAEIYFQKFLNSNIFKQYVQQLRHTLQHVSDEAKSCGSGRSSISLEDHNFPLMEKTESKLDLFDETSLEDFWFKTPEADKSFSASRLTLGHVNEFGVFCSGMEEQPPDEKKKDSSVAILGKKMKNLLRGETPEETEQLAWERARKIINEIQNQTQS